MTTNENITRGEYLRADGTRVQIFGENEGPAPIGNLEVNTKFYVPAHAVLERGEITPGSGARAVSMVGLQIVEGVGIPRPLFVSYFAPRNFDGTSVLPDEPLAKMFSVAPQVGLSKIKGKVVEVVEVLENARTRQRRENGVPMFDENNNAIVEKTACAYKWTVRDLDPKKDAMSVEAAEKMVDDFYKNNYKRVEPVVEEEE